MVQAKLAFDEKLGLDYKHRTQSKGKRTVSFVEKISLIASVIGIISALVSFWKQISREFKIGLAVLCWGIVILFFGFLWAGANPNQETRTVAAIIINIALFLTIFIMLE